MLRQALGSRLGGRRLFSRDNQARCRRTTRNSCLQFCSITGLESTKTFNTVYKYASRLAMASFVPCFPVQANKVEILDNPTQFYRTLKDEITKANDRITMAALYLGSDDMEKELVCCLSDKMGESDVDFTILLDHARGTRGKENSCTLLQTLVDNFPEKVRVALYHSPHLRGLTRSYLPGRLTESIGLNHIKVFICDSNILITGANLSESYFTNRQDRYIMIREAPKLANFFDQLVKTVATFSLELKRGGQIEPHPECPSHPYQGDQAVFIKESRSRIMKMIQKQCMKDWNANATSDNELVTMTKSDFRLELACDSFMDKCEIGNHVQNGSPDTLVYPLLQMGQLGVYFDELVLNQILEEAPEKSEIYLASGYFNLTQEYIDRIVNVSKANYNILTASPQVNGFYGARGVAGKVPDVYTQISKQFCDKLEQTSTTDRIKLYEYFRENWTFHVKGLWYYPRGQSLPTMTMIGSPNFGHRSVHRDLEAQIAIVTKNEDLRRRMHDERGRIYELSKRVDRSTFDASERRVPMLVRMATGYLQSFF